MKNCFKAGLLIMALSLFAFQFSCSEAGSRVSPDDEYYLQQQMLEDMSGEEQDDLIGDEIDNDGSSIDWAAPIPENVLNGEDAE